MAGVDVASLDFEEILDHVVGWHDQLGEQFLNDGLYLRLEMTEPSQLWQFDLVDDLLELFVH